VSRPLARRPRGHLPERLERDLLQQPEPNGYTIGKPVLNPPEFTGLPGFYVPVLGRSGLTATLLPWPDGSESTVAISTHLLQELIEEDVDSWPRCPQHQHHLVPRTVDGVASWTCPDDESLSWRIGDLPAAAAQ
jgi:hypothetical protein